MDVYSVDDQRLAARIWRRKHTQPRCFGCELPAATRLGAKDLCQLSRLARGRQGSTSHTRGVSANSLLFKA